MSQQLSVDNHITLFLAEPKDQQLWDTYVLQHPASSPYHLFPWKVAVEKAYGHRCYYVYAKKEGKIVGVLPLVHIHCPGIINELTALPYCDVGNCLCNNEAVQDALLNEAVSIQYRLRSKRLHLRGPLKKTELQNTVFHADETGKVRMLLELPSSSDELFASFKSKLRSQVRKAEKNGVCFRWSGLDDLNTIYSVFSRNMHELGSPVHAKSWLQSVLISYGQRAKVGVVEFEDKAVGMGVILLGGCSVSIPWASTLREYNRLGPNMLLYWNLLKFSADNDFNTFDFGRSTMGEGTFKFKKQWGAQPEPLTWYTDGEAGKSDEQPGQNNGPRGMVTGIWQKIPLSLANFIGPHLRKYISL